MMQPSLAVPACYVPKAGSTFSYSQMFKGAQLLRRTQVAGNRKKFTLACWTSPGGIGQRLAGAAYEPVPGSASVRDEIWAGPISAGFLAQGDAVRTKPAAYIPIKGNGFIAQVIAFDTDQPVAPSGTYRVLVLARRPGFLDLGIYLGNDLADGAFSPSDLCDDFILIKDTLVGNTSPWYLALACLTNNENPVRVFYPNTSGLDSDGTPMDLVVGGTKMRHASGDPNYAGRTYCTVQIGRPIGGVCVAPATAR
jgi:hypothetical protein